MKRITFLFICMLVPLSALADFQLNMTKGVSSVSHDIYDLHMLIFWICVVIGVGVFGVMFYSIFYHRKSKGAQAANFHENTTVEVVWTAIPLLILILMAIPATKTLIDLENTEKSDMAVKVTGYQWKWQYEYPNEDISFFSNLSKKSRDSVYNKEHHKEYLLDVDNRLVLPVGKRVRFLFTSNDVIHSWWVPALGIKQDAIPGFINDSWVKIDEPGIYRGQCAELCGKDHGFMPAVVEAKSQVDYDQWVIVQKQLALVEKTGASKFWSKQDLMDKGKKVYNGTCAACHGSTGLGIPGAFPAIKDSPIVLGDVKGHMDIVMNGKAGTAMQAFKRQLSDVDLAAVITYQRNSFGNNVGDIVQPSQIKSAR